MAMLIAYPSVSEAQRPKTNKKTKTLKNRLNEFTKRADEWKKSLINNVWVLRTCYRPTPSLEPEHILRGKKRTKFYCG